jgi:hypothetical protein
MVEVDRNERTPVKVDFGLLAPIRLYGPSAFQFSTYWYTSTFWEIGYVFPANRSTIFFYVVALRAGLFKRNGPSGRSFSNIIII